MDQDTVGTPGPESGQSVPDDVAVAPAARPAGSALEGGARKMEILMDLSLPVAIELGRTQMFIRDILELQRGSVVEFDKLTSEPVDVLINGKKMAEGEVVVIEKHFGIRITNLVEQAERVEGLGK